MSLLEETYSIDERIYFEKGKIVPIKAFYVINEHDNNVYLEKSNGTVERIGSIEYWERVKKFVPTKKARLKHVTNNSFCCLSCGLCSLHKNKTALLNIVITNRCNLRCWYCFFYSEAYGGVYEPSIEEIENMIKVSREMNGYVPPIQLTGGEPTLRKDLDLIVELIKKYNSPHIQLNTNSVLHGIEYYEDRKKCVENLKILKRKGLNTIYTSFDGLSIETNIKNYYEFPYALEAYRESGIRSVVLVPTIHSKNINEVVSIVKLALKNLDVIRGVNFQPISIVGMVPKSEREKLRVTQSDIIEKLYDLGLTYEDFFPVSAAQNLADLISRKDEHVTFYNSEKCGMATYVFFDADSKKVRPITSYIDVDRFLHDLKKSESALGKLFFGLNIFRYALRELSVRRGLGEYLQKYLVEEELPDGSNLKKILREVIDKGNYSSLGEFHRRTLFIGMMHFMDPYNYDINRVQRCSIHYASPDGRIIPFCTYNVFPEIYRDEIIRKFSFKDENLIKEEKQQFKRVVEFRSNVDKSYVSRFYQLNF